jgi:preprotein translocase SecE subunit
MLELRRVAWPTRQSTLSNAAVVLAVVVTVAALLAGLDAAFAKLSSALIS